MDTYQKTLSALFIVILVGAMAVCATWHLPKFLFQGSDKWKVVVKVFIHHTDVKLVLYELLF